MFADARRMRVAVVAALVVYAVLFVWAVVLLPRGATTQVDKGWTSSFTSPQFVIFVESHGPSDGKLQVGDRLVGVGDDFSFRGYDLPVSQVARLPANSTFQLTVLRGNQLVKTDITLRTKRKPDWGIYVVLMMIGSLAFMGCGVLMGWKRPDLRTAQIGWLTCVLTAIFFINFSFQVSGGMRLVGRIANLPFFWLHLAAYSFVASFGASGEEPRGWRWFRRFLFLSCFLLSVNNLITRLITASWIRPVLRAYPGWFVHASDRLVTAYFLLIVVGSLAALVRNYRNAESAADRRRIELVGGVVVFGLVSALITSALQNISQRFNGTTVIAGNLLAICVPFAFCYVVLAHQVMEIRLVVRRGMQYLLAKQVMRLVLLLPVVVIAVYALRHPNAPIGSALNLGGLAVIGVAVLCLGWRDRILGAVDRLFFRERFDRDKLMLELLGEIGRATSVGHIMSLTQNRVTALFAAEYVFITGSTLLPVTGPHAEVELALPLQNLDGEVSGWMYVGPQRSGEAYTTAEKDLLEMVAIQIGLRQDVLSPEGKKRMVAYAVDQERLRIAQELHDTLGQGFAGISLYLNAAGKALSNSPEKTGELLEAARNIAKISAQETRDSLRGLRAPTAGGRHLEARLRGIANRFVKDASASPAFLLDISEGCCDLASDDAGWHLARVAEEAVTNACKHAAATQIRVQLDAREGKLELRVSDDGVGFAAPNTVADGFGLQGMQERMASVRGAVEINSQPGRGTQVIAMVPFAAASE